MKNQTILIIHIHWPVLNVCLILYHTTLPQHSPFSAGTFTLAGDSGADSGTIQYNGADVCYEEGYFDDNAAASICGELGYAYADAWDTVQGSNNIGTLSKIKCTDARAWSSCLFSDESVCGSSDVIVVNCKCELIVDCNLQFDFSTTYLLFTK